MVERARWDITLTFRIKGRNRSLEMEAFNIRGTEFGSHMWLWEDGYLYHPGKNAYDPPFLEA